MIAITRYLATAAATLAAGIAVAQQPAPPAPPVFAPSNLTPAGMRSLAANCAACHGTNGRSAAASTVVGLAGKPRDELQTALTGFKSGKKRGLLMQQLAKGYSDEELASLSEYFSKQSR
jgi:cytochrome subunit of sulfide dehydrogenase